MSIRRLYRYRYKPSREDVALLFDSFRVNGLSLRNRVAMAPMTREMAPGGVPTTAMADYYARRADGGAGLIITEGAAPDMAGAFGASVPRLYGNDALDGWRRVVDPVHAGGAAIFAQLWHVGAFSPSMIGMADSIDAIRLSPSGLAAPGRPFGRAMTTQDIADTIGSFATAAASARAIGFDGVEIHGAHGYLVDQFLWSQTNLREDCYAEPVRFAVELVAAVRAATAADFPIGLRLSQWKQLDYGARLADTPEALAAIVAPLAKAGVDLFHCSTRRFWDAAFAGDPRTLAGWVRALTGTPTMAVGSITLDTDFKAATGKLHAGTTTDHVAMVERALAAGEYDMIAVGRAMIANPDWAAIVARGDARHLQPFDKGGLDQLT
jgi:2,4-dienoyl-CoA reductase-like NADH-dependent reductase (Old Yellow Enzyme family)